MQSIDMMGLLAVAAFVAMFAVFVLSATGGS
jgi:hypothetical protein